jgi:DNA invertase Pin-like site-specific DNA recombinase
MTPLRRAAIYVRVSTTKQTTENQEHVLRKACIDRGWDLQAVYDDTGHSGSKTSRPALDAMLKDATRGRFDVLLIWKLDRLGRSVIDLHSNAEHLKACGVDLCAYTQAIDTSTPTGKLMFTVLAAVAEFERETIIERINTGLDTARRKGVQLGRRRSIPEEKREAIRASLAGGKGIKSTAALHGVGVLTVQNIKKEMVNG